MKKALIALSALLISVATYAQGTLGAVSFNTRVPGVLDAPVFDVGGVNPPPAGTKAELVIVSGGTTTVIPASVTTFRTDRADRAMYVNPVDVDVPGTAPGGTVTLRYRAYVGSDFASATQKGQSADVTVTGLGGGNLPPSNLVGLTGFTLTPEPTTLALGALGAAALLFRRRK